MTDTKKENNSFAYLKFKQLCDKNNVTPYQVSVGTEGKVSTAVLSQWKNGDYDLKLEKLTLIANFFNVSITEFIEV